MLYASAPIFIGFALFFSPSVTGWLLPCGWLFAYLARVHRAICTAIRVDLVFALMGKGGVQELRVSLTASDTAMIFAIDAS